MNSLPILTPDSAPAESRPILESARGSMGFVPNMFGVLSASPAALEAYTSLAALQDKKTAFDETERQVLFVSISAANGCEYCVAAHSLISKGKRVAGDVIQALREGTPLPTERLNALRTFALAVVESRGHIDAEDLSAFKNAGFEDRHVLEVVLAIAFKTISNYTNQIAGTALDEAFQPERWSAAVA